MCTYDMNTYQTHMIHTLPNTGTGNRQLLLTKLPYDRIETTSCCCLPSTSTATATVVLVAERNDPVQDRFKLTFGGTTPMSQGPEFTGIKHSKTSIREALEGVDEQAWYATYGSTMALLSLVHACYLIHMAVGKHTRRRHRHSRSRSTTVVNYHKVVHRKQFHLLIGAVLNHHPNPEANTSYSSTRSSVLERSRLDVPAGNHREEPTPNTSSDLVSARQGLTFLSLPLPSTPSSWLTFFNNGPFRTGNILQGLPLLFYCAHCLWACRALEVIYRDADYTRVLWTLTWTAFFLDFAFTRMALGVVRELNFATSAPFVMDDSPRDDAVDSGARSTTIASRVHRTLMHRSIGSLTATTAAVLFLFQDHFDAPIPILPFLSIKGPILGTPVVSWIMVITILLRLSHSTHPVMGVACGTVSGLFWVSGWTFWLAERYWSCGMLMLYLGLCVLSLKLHGKVYLPCVDYIPWNRDGHLVLRREEGGETLMGMNQGTDDSSIHSEASLGAYDAEDEEEDAIELAISSRRPQTDRPSSSSTTTSLTGRSEQHRNVESDSEHAPLPSAVSASLSMRSRRVPVIGRR